MHVGRSLSEREAPNSTFFNKFNLVQSIYKAVSCRVSIAIASALGPCFESCKGVEQGCSSTLYGIIIDRFYFMLMHQTSGHVGPALRSSKRMYANLVYADNGLLLSTDYVGMHKCCACLDVFYKQSHMRLNMEPGKTEMIIFGV